MAPWWRCRATFEALGLPPRLVRQTVIPSPAANRGLLEHPGRPALTTILGQWTVTPAPRSLEHLCLQGGGCGLVVGGPVDTPTEIGTRPQHRLQCALVGGTLDYTGSEGEANDKRTTGHALSKNLSKVFRRNAVLLAKVRNIGFRAWARQDARQPDRRVRSHVEAKLSVCGRPAGKEGVGRS